MQLRRHDLVWLDPSIDIYSYAVATEHINEAHRWIKQGRPLVVARQPDTPDSQANQVTLGFTLPSAPMRTRISLRAPRTAIIRHARPLPLLDVIDYAPDDWRTSIYNLHALCEKAGAIARVYGSLSSQAVTGENYLDATSDLDLLLECSEDTQLLSLLAALENFPLQIPRIDGEIFAPTGWAVAWRELAAAVRTGTPQQVLVKSDCEARLMPVDHFFPRQLALSA